MIEEVAKIYFGLVRIPSGKGRPRAVFKKEWDDLTDKEKEEFIEQARLVIEAINITGRKILDKDQIIQTRPRVDPTRYGERPC